MGIVFYGVTMFKELKRAFYKLYPKYRVEEFQGREVVRDLSLTFNIGGKEVHPYITLE